jgi:adenylyltransferase/sulfurtransferase
MTLSADELERYSRQMGLPDWGGDGQERIDTRSAPALIAGHDIAIDCLDTLEARFVLNRACVALDIPMLYAAVGGFTGQLSFIHPPTTPCLECFIPHKIPTEKPQVSGCTTGMISSLEALEAIKYLTGIGRTLAGRLLIVEGVEPRFDILEIEKDPDCPACGSQAE